MIHSGFGKQSKEAEMNYSEIAPEELNTTRSELLKPVMNTAAKSPLT